MSRASEEDRPLEVVPHTPGQLLWAIVLAPPWAVIGPPLDDDYWADRDRPAPHVVADVNKTVALLALTRALEEELEEELEAKETR